MNDTRYSNTENLEEYIENIKNNEFDKNVTIHESQSKESKQKEYMLLGLRKLEGVKIYLDKTQFIFIIKN